MQCAPGFPAFFHLLVFTNCQPRWGEPWWHSWVISDPVSNSSPTDNPNKIHWFTMLDFGVICTLVCLEYPIWSRKMNVFHMPRKCFVIRVQANKYKLKLVMSFPIHFLHPLYFCFPFFLQSTCKLQKVHHTDQWQEQSLFLMFLSPLRSEPKVWFTSLCSNKI